jgi:dipeptidyl aminopeptidase/acylaminoacyl peptidase
VRIALVPLSLVGLFLLAVGCPKPPPPRPLMPLAPPPPPPKPKKREIPKAEEDIPAPECGERDKVLADLFGAYLEAFSNVGLELSPDGKTLLFLSNRGGGSFQLYTAPVGRPHAEPTPIAPAKDRVADARFTPDGTYILFTRDRDNNENTQIYRATPDGKDVVQLTVAPKWYHRLPRVTADGKTLIYLRGSHRARRTELVGQPIEGGKARVIAAFAGLYVLSDLSPDGTRALVFKYISPSESKLELVDLTSGKVKLLAPLEGKQIHANRAMFTADGKSVLVVTDEGGERAGVHRIEAESGKVDTFYYDPAVEVTDLEYAPKTDVLAVELNAGSHKALRLLEGATLKEKRRVRLPLGTVGIGRFTADGKGLVVTISTPDKPYDAHLVDSRSGYLRPLRREKRPSLRKLGRIKASTLKIPAADKAEVPLNLYLPWRLRRKDKLPVVVWVHGGPASVSSIRWNPLVGFWVSRGFAVVEPNVRGSVGFGKAYEQADNGRKRMDAVNDLGVVNRWIREQRWADPEKLVVAGASYGGYMTYMALGHQPDQWHAGIGMMGVVNLLTLLTNTSGMLKEVLRGEFGQLPAERQFLASISPIAVVRRMRAPVFVYQGANDPRVPRSEQDQLIHALRRQGVPVEYMVASDEGHSLSHRHNKLQLMGRSTRFLEQHLGLPGVPEDCRTAKAKPGEQPPATQPPPAQPAPAKPAPAKPAPARPAPARPAPAQPAPPAPAPPPGR